MADLTYWQKRHLKTKQKALKNAETYEEDYQKRLKKAQREIEQEIQAWVGKYATEDGDLTPQGANKILKGQDESWWNNTLDQWEKKALDGGYDKELNLEYYRSRVSRLQALEGQISNIMAEHTAPEVERMQEQLSLSYEETYYRTTYNTQAQGQSFSGDFAKLNDDQLAKVVSKPWAGSNFSKRLWGNMTQQLPNKLAKTLSRGVLLGHGVDRMVKDSRVVFKNASSRDIHRLITTEFAHVAEQATLDSYHDSGIEQYEYMATLEKRTCERCGGLDGKVFDTHKQEVGTNYPPLHPYCRCTTAPYFDELKEMETTRWARDDNGNAMSVKDMSYDQWKKEFMPLKDDPNGLTWYEHSALNRYISSDSYKINDILRRGDDLTPEFESVARYLDNALDKLPVYSGTTWRSLTPVDPYEFVAEYAVGSVVDMPAYTSTSPEIYGPDMMVQMKFVNSKDGRDIRRYNDNEQEVLYKRGTKVKVLNVYKDDGMNIMEVEEQ